MITNVTENIKYIGVDDTDLDLFESQYIIPNGISYNSYLIADEKIAIMDTVDRRKSEDWWDNLEEALAGRTPDYLVVQHLEPDHAGNIAAALEKYPTLKVVASAKAIQMMPQFFEHTDFSGRTIAVKEGETLDLGTHTLKFFMAPMVHWPEVMMSYDSTDKVLFSADAFGKFGANDVEDPEGWACEARRYYFGIVGKYGVQAQAVLKKAANLDIQTICPLHGPVLNENLGYYLDLYNTWTTYGVETEGVALFYTSVYGNTKKAVEILADKLREKGCPKVVVNDLARTDMAEDVEDAFRYGKIVLATTTYNGDLFPFMREFINDLTERGYKNRTIGIIENGTWAATCAKNIKKAFETAKNITFTDTTVTLKSAVSEANLAEIDALADELLK